MSKDFSKSTNASESIGCVSRKQKFVTNPTPSAVTRYVCISKDAHGSSHSQPLAFWESVRNNDPVVTQHVCSFEESGSGDSSSVTSTNAVLKKHVAVIPADAVPAFAGFCSVDGFSPKRHRQHEHITHKQHPAPHIQSCREQHKSTRITPHTWREQINIIQKEDAVAAGDVVDSTVTVSAVMSKGVNDPEDCPKAVANAPDVLSVNIDNAKTENLTTNIQVKSVDSMRRTSTQVHDLKSTNFEKKSSPETPKRKLFHNRNKTREYILQQKLKRKERFATEQSKKNMEDEMKKAKLQTLREKSLRIVQTNVKKSLSKKKSTEISNNLERDTNSNSYGKVDDLQAPAVNINTKSISEKSVTVRKYKVTETRSSRLPLSPKCDNNIDVPQNSSLHDNNVENSNKKSNVALESEENQQMRNELDLKIRAVAKALSAELESSILHSRDDLSDKMTEDSNNLSLQRPLLRLRETVCNRQPVTDDMVTRRVVNIDSATRNISDSPPTKLKRYDHTKQMESLEKKMEMANNTISMLRDKNIIKSVEQSDGRPEKLLKENSIELEEKIRQRTVESPQHYFSKRSAFPFNPGQHLEKSRKLVKKRRITDKTKNIQNHLITSKQTVMNHVPEMSMEYSPATTTHISEYDIIEKRGNVPPQVSKHLDEVMTSNFLPSTFNHNLHRKESKNCVTPLNQKPDPELVNNRKTTDDYCNVRPDKKSQVWTDSVTTDTDPVKECGSWLQPKEKLQELLMKQTYKNDKYVIKAPSTPVKTKSGAPAELFRRAVEREKREKAATQIQALYRGHSTRKITAPLLIGTKSKADVQRTELQEEECQSSTKKETKHTEDLSGSKLKTVEPTDWLELEPVKPCPYNVMTAVRQKLLALRNISDAEIETQTATVFTDKTLASYKSGTEGNNASTTEKDKEVCTSGLWVEENATVQKISVSPIVEKRKQVQAVQLRGAKEYSLSNAERKSDNRKRSGSNKNYAFFEQAGWIENEEQEQKAIESLHPSATNKTNSTQNSRNQNKTSESSIKSSVVGSGTEPSLTCNLKNSSENLALPDVHLVRKRKHSGNETTSIPPNSNDLCLSGKQERGNSLPTRKEDWIEASVHLSSDQTSFPSETRNRRKDSEGENHCTESITVAKSNHGSTNSNYSKKAMSSTNISDTARAETSSTRCTGTPLETETKKTVSAYSGSSANGRHKRHNFHNVLESGKMLPPEALHLHFQAEMNLLESLEESRLRLAHIEGLHALSLIQCQNHPIAAEQKDEQEHQVQAMSDQHQRPASKHKIDAFDENRREFNAVLKSMRKCAALSGAKPEDIDWVTFSDVSNPVKGSNSQVRCGKEEKDLFQTEKSLLNNSEMNFLGENKETKNKYSYDSSFTSVSEDISGHTSSTKSKHTKINAISDSTVEKTLDAALKRGQISISAYCKYQKLIQEEAVRALEQEKLLDTTEQALVDRFKTDMKLLETNRRQLKQCGKENLIPSIKKKQRALILKLEHDREEIKRLRKTYLEASKEWKNLLLQQLTLTKFNVRDSEILGPTQQEKLLKSTTRNGTEPGKPFNADTQKSAGPSTSPLQTDISSSIQTELSQHSAQSTRSAGWGSWSCNQKTENSGTVQSNVEVCTALSKTETAVQTNSAENRHSLLPSKRLWSHDEISEWQQSPGEDERRVRPFRYHRDNSVSPMRVLKTEKQHINLSGNADTLPMENNSIATCFDIDSICGKNSYSGRGVPVVEGNTKNSLTSQKSAASISSVEVLRKRSEVSIRVPISPTIGVKRQSSGSDESIMFSQGDTPSEQSDLEGRVCALREQLRRRELEAEQLKQLQRRKARREKLKATEQSLLKQIQVLDSYITRTKEQLKQDFNKSPLPAVKPKIKQPRVRTEQSSKNIVDKSGEKFQQHEQSEQYSNHVLGKAEFKSLPDDTSQKSTSNGTSSEIPTVILSEQTTNSITFLPEDNNSIPLRESHTSEEDNRYNKVLDSCITQIKEELIQDFKKTPVPAVKPKVKQPQVQTEYTLKHIMDKIKEKPQRELPELNSTDMLDKAEYKSSPDDASQKSISNGINTEVSTDTLSEQRTNAVTFLPEDNNSTTLREAHTSEENNHQDDIVCITGSYERSTEALNSSEEHVSNAKSSYSKNKTLTIKTSSIEEISSVSSDQQSSVHLKHSKSEQQFSAREWSSGESIIPTILTSGELSLEEDREVSEILIDSTFVVNNADFSTTEQHSGSKNDYAQQSCVSPSLKPLDKSSSDKSKNLLYKKSDSLVKSIVSQWNDSKSCMSVTTNEEISEIEGTSQSMQHISDIAEVQKVSSLDSIQHEISEKPELEIDNVLNITTLVPLPQNVSGSECILAADTEIKYASPDILVVKREEIKDNTQEILSTENQSQPSEKEISEDSVLSVYSYNSEHGRNVAQFQDSSNDSSCTESHHIPVQLNSTFVVKQEEHAPQAQTVDQSKINYASEENENRMQKLRLVDSITESIMLQLLKDSFVLPDSKMKQCEDVPNANASRTTVLSNEHKFIETTKPDFDLVREIRPDSRTVILGETEKQDNLATEQEANPVDDFCISNTTFILNESSNTQKNTSGLVDEMLNHFLKNATNDVLNIYNTKLSNTDILCVHSEASKEYTQNTSLATSDTGKGNDLKIPAQDSTCKPSEIINITLTYDNTNQSVNDINNHNLNESFHNSKERNALENGMQDTISFTSSDSKLVQEIELSAEDVLKPVPEHSTCEKLMSRIDNEQSHETEKDDVSSGCLISDQGVGRAHHGLKTADEVVMSEEPLPNGCKSKVASQNGNKLKDVSHLQKVEVRGKQPLNNETFPPGWFDEDLDLSNSWREAEQLRLQQLHIEQEIRRLEEQQHQQQALVLVREIPDKPPPPYTPRGTTPQSSSPLYPPPAIGASAPRHRLIELVAEATPLLTSSVTLPMLPPEDFCTGFNPSIRRFIFDLSRSLVNEAVSVPGTDDDWDEETAPQQMTVKRSQEAVRAHVARRATALLDGSASAGTAGASKLRRLAVGPRWRRRDHVDELLVREARDEEPGWIDYRRDEAHLRNETACALLKDLLDDTVTAVTTAIARRMAPKTTGVM